MKKDIETRLNQTVNNQKNKTGGNAEALQKKITAFFVQADVMEKEICGLGYTETETKALLEKIEGLKEEIAALQIGNLSEKKKKNFEKDNSEDLILNNLLFLKEISRQMLKELEQHNSALAGCLKKVEKNVDLRGSAQVKSKLNKCVDSLPNTCLISFMITLFLIIILVSSLLYIIGLSYRSCTFPLKNVFNQASHS